MSQETPPSFPAREQREFKYRGATIHISIAESDNAHTDSDVTVNMLLFARDDSHDDPSHKVLKSTSFGNIEDTIDELIGEAKEIIDEQAELCEAFKNMLIDAEDRNELMRH